MDMPWPPSPPQNPWANMPTPWPPSAPAPGPLPPKPPTQAELAAAAAQSDVNGAWGANGVPGGVWGMLARQGAVDDQQKGSNLGALRQADDNASFVGPPDDLAGSAGGAAADPAAALASLASGTAGARGAAGPGQNVPRGAGGAAAPAARDLSSMLDARSLEALKAQGLTVGSMQDKLSKLQGAALPTDFRPLAGLVDAWTGSKMGAMATPSETAEQRRASIAQLQQEILKGQQGMSQDELGMLKTKLQAQFHEDEIAARERERQAALEQTRTMGAIGRQTHQDYHDQMTFTKAASALTAADEFKKPLAQSEDIDKFQQLSKDAANGNPLARATLSLETIKQFVNRVSQGELEAVKGGEAKGLQNRAEQLYKDLTSGGLTEANYKVFSEFSQSLKQVNDKALLNGMERHANIYMSTPGVTKRDMPEVANAISGGKYSQVKASVDSAAKLDAAKRWLADPKNASDPSYAEIKARVQ